MTQPLALVTGASSGIGVEIARELARRGHPLVLVARRRPRLEALAESIRAAHGVRVEVEAWDLSRPESAQGLYAALAGRGLEVGVLVNNAGFGMQGRLIDMDLARIEEMIQLNVLGLTRLTWLYARDMAARGRGQILQVASAVAFLPSPQVAAYAGTKHYVKAMSEALGYELRGTGVTVTTLYPGITRTEFNTVADAKTPGVMSLSVLDADAVARAGVEAMLAGRRAVVPGWINRLNAALSEILHRGLVLSLAGWLLERANRPER